MHSLKLAEIEVNRKCLDLAVNDAAAFTALADAAKKQKLGKYVIKAENVYPNFQYQCRGGIGNQI